MVSNDGNLKITIYKLIHKIFLINGKLLSKKKKAKFIRNLITVAIYLRSKLNRKIIYFN